MAEQGVTLEQMEALLKEELTPLKEAISSMESKLEAHDPSLEDLSRRFSVLEDAPAQSGIDEKVKLEVDSQMKTVHGIIDKDMDNIALNHEDKMTKMTASHDSQMTKMMEANETNSTRLIDQLVAHATSVHEGKSVHGGIHSSGNKTCVDFDPAGCPNIYFDGRIYRKVYGWWGSSPATNYAYQTPFGTFLDTRGQLEGLLKLVSYQGEFALGNLF